MKWGCIPFLPEGRRNLGVFVTVVKWLRVASVIPDGIQVVRYSYETVRIGLLDQRMTFDNPRNRMVGTMRKNQFFLLCALAALFVMRVVGQFAVAFFHVGFLPPVEAWMSGVMPYSWLLAAQLAIIFLMAKVCLDLHRSNGFFARKSGRFGRFLLEGGALYLLVMSLRYAIHMALYPHERWFGGAIPIFFHIVLAGFVLVWGSFHLQTVRQKVGNRWTARVFRVSAMLGILLWIAYLLAPYVMAQQFHLRPAVYAVKIEPDVPVPVAPGVMLVADIYHPMHLDRSPTVLVRIPYTKNPTNMLTANIIGRLWAERGYTAVVQCTRGRGGSGGEYYPLSNDREDGIKTLHWLSKQPWYDGHIAGWGGSSFGISQWAIADQSAPGFSAMHIYEASTNIYRMFHPGGAFSLYSALAWAVTCGRKTDLPQWPKPEKIAERADVFPLADADRNSTGMEVDFFNDWVSHSGRDRYWQDIDGIERTKSLKAPVLLMAGWCDAFLPTQLQDYLKVKAEAEPDVAQRTKLVIGPWIHGDEFVLPDGTKPSLFRAATLALSLDWFDHIVLGRPLPAQISCLNPHHRGDLCRCNVPHLSSAPIQIFIMGKNFWRSENEWPLARTQFTSLYLNRDKLSFSKPVDRQKPDRFVYDPRRPVPTAGGAMIGKVPAMIKQNAAQSRPDVLCFTTDLLKHDVELTGPVKAELFVSSDAPCTDFTAKLVDVHPDGTAYNVCDGILRRRFSGSKVQKVEIELWPTSMVFFKKHKIRLDVSSSNFPRYDRNPNTGRPSAFETNPRIAVQTVFHDSNFPSRLIVPVIP